VPVADRKNNKLVQQRQLQVINTEIVITDRYAETLHFSAMLHHTGQPVAILLSCIQHRLVKTLLMNK